MSEIPHVTIMCGYISTKKYEISARTKRVYSHDNEGDVDTDAEHDGNRGEAINLCKLLKH